MPGETGTAVAQGAAATPATGQPPGAQGAASEPETGATTAAQGASADAQGADDGTSGATSAVDLAAKVAQLERDNRKYRQDAARAEAERKARADAELSEVERLTARNAELEQTLSAREQREKEQSLRLAATNAAARLGYKDPDLAWKLIATESFEFAEDGTPKGVEPRLAALAKDHSYLVSGQDFGGGVRGASPTQTGAADINTLIRQAASKQS